MRLVLLGPPGAGKGTQARLLTAKFDVAHISAGDLLRKAVADGSELGRTAKPIMAKGALVPDGVVIEIIEERLRRPDCAGGYILDGFPRTLRQAEALSEVLQLLHAPLDCVISVEAPEEDLVRRLAGRRICGVCGSMFHIDTKPPVRIGICDNCGDRLLQRDDDREDTIRHRLRVYREQTELLIAYYETLGLLRRIDGHGTIDQIAQRIHQAFGDE
ncbi:adenylate kinase [Candidatus Methylomirabilis lanthanidiphila]|uniref:Adenylate kinase n=1 Tax=Candidatus Methylomirabilis lanthanidiphila TaxID=2211376 RepID=A0A564ZIF5_9BACT|nr:adenylate kinase [Candidatus Methylomirabilis lanthanidiphila]VUZ84422.1 adenylate kinase [Candidatus Methylomirabilis lanthanidiphila]